MTNNEIGPGKANSPATDGQTEALPFIPGQRKSRAGKLKFLVVVLIVVGALATCATIYMQRMYRHHQEEKLAAAQKPKDSQADSMVDIGSEQDRIRREEAEAARRASDAAAASAALAIPAGAASQSTTAGAPGTSGQAASAPITPEQRRLAGEVAVAINTGHEGARHGKGGDTLDADANRSDAKGSAFDEDLRPSQLKPMRASFRTNRSGLLSRNTTIRCVQDTAIITDYPGLIGCTVAEDVWSDDGSTLLVRKGAEAKGEQRKAVLQGQGRIFTIWNEIDDGNVKITLDSPGTDALGASGQAAYVDEHFWTRFKGALMVSLVGDFGQALANKTTSGGNNTISLSNSSNATQEVAADTLRGTINIPPTAYSNQGSIINIFVARDVDLSGQYENVRADGTVLPQPAQ
jgi:type IV secretion system protein VirB10